jgi:hypothetical protein
MAMAMMGRLGHRAAQCAHPAEHGGGAEQARTAFQEIATADQALDFTRVFADLSEIMGGGIEIRHAILSASGMPKSLGGSCRVGVGYDETLKLFLQRASCECAQPRFSENAAQRNIPCLSRHGFIGAL